MEIKNEDFPIKLNYLLIDEKININDRLGNKNKQIFLLHNYENEVKLDSGIIFEQYGQNLEHNCPSGINSIGGALLSKDYKVIGINKGKKPIDNNFIG